jgi:hypothetical protein
MNKFWRTELWRWVLVPCAATAAYFLALVLGVLLLISSRFPPSLAEPTAGFIMGLAVVIAGSVMAPRHRLATAIVLCILGALSAAIFVRFLFLSACIGGLAAFGFIAWWYRPGRTGSATRRVALIASGVFITILVIVYSRHADWPARADPLPPQLADILGTNGSRVVAFYRYDRGGFIDHEWLWRVDTDSNMVELMVTKLDLQPTNTVPRQFWRLPPFYWPRSMPADAVAFQSRLFWGDQRGPDGSHYFLLHDRQRKRAFVWVKDNF